MNMLLLGVGALIAGLVIGYHDQRSLGCGPVLRADDSYIVTGNDRDFVCAAVHSESFNWTVTLLVLGVVLLVGALIQASRNRPSRRAAG